MTSWKNVKDSHRPTQSSVRVPMRADLPDEIKRLEEVARYEAALDERENREPLAPKVAEQIQLLEVQLAQSLVDFRFVAIGRRSYNALLTEHPPTDEQVAEAAEANSRVLYNHETFPPALLFASCVAPSDMTIEDWAEIWQDWDEGQIQPLFSSCLIANMAGASADVLPKSQIASEILSALEPS